MDNSNSATIATATALLAECSRMMRERQFGTIEIRDIYQLASGGLAKIGMCAQCDAKTYEYTLTSLPVGEVKIVQIDARAN